MEMTLGIFTSGERTLVHGNLLLVLALVSHPFAKAVLWSLLLPVEVIRSVTVGAVAAPTVGHFLVHFLPFRGPVSHAVT